MAIYKALENHGLKTFKEKHDTKKIARPVNPNLMVQQQLKYPDKMMFRLLIKNNLFTRKSNVSC